MAKPDKHHRHRRRKDAIYYICVFTTGEYKVSSTYNTNSPTLIKVYGPWSYDKCVWWIKLLKDPGFNTSGLEKYVVWFNPKPITPQESMEKKDEPEENKKEEGKD